MSGKDDVSQRRASHFIRHFKFDADSTRESIGEAKAMLVVAGLCQPGEVDAYMYNIMGSERWERDAERFPELFPKSQEELVEELQQGGHVYEIQKIVRAERRCREGALNSTMHYRVRYKGYTKDFDEWLEEDELRLAPEILQQFKSKSGLLQ